ncbi:MAG: hypothetical protein ACWIPJ_10715 [Polaribacter sp.]
MNSKAYLGAWGSSGSDERNWDSDWNTWDESDYNSNGKVELPGFDLGNGNDGDDWGWGDNSGGWGDGGPGDDYGGGGNGDDNQEIEEWSKLDFMDHYNNGDGKTVTLLGVGYLDKIKKSSTYKEVLDRVKD